MVYVMYMSCICMVYNMNMSCICMEYVMYIVFEYVMDMHGIYLLYPRLACIYMVYTWYIPCISKAYGNLIHMCGIYQLKYKWVCSLPFFILIYLWYTINILWIICMCWWVSASTNILFKFQCICCKYTYIYNVYTTYILPKILWCTA